MASCISSKERARKRSVAKKKEGRRFGALVIGTGRQAVDVSSIGFPAETDRRNDEFTRLQSLTVSRNSEEICEGEGWRYSIDEGNAVITKDCYPPTLGFDPRILFRFSLPAYEFRYTTSWDLKSRCFYFPPSFSPSFPTSSLAIQGKDTIMNSNLDSTGSFGRDLY